MTIRKGQEWGESIDRPPDLQEVTSDADVVAAIGAGAVPGLVGGDLHRSLGSPSRRAVMQRLPIDLVSVTADGYSFTAIAHVVLRRRWWWWRGSVVAVMNVDHLGEWYVAPRAHPNDGHFDVVEVEPSMTARERLQARRRLVTGTHLPHPKISVRTAERGSWEFPVRHQVWVDGVHVVDAHEVMMSIDADAGAVLV